MSEDSRKVEEIAAIPQVVDRESMAKSINSARGRDDTRLPAKILKVTQGIPARKPSTMAGVKDVFVDVLPLRMFPKLLSEFVGEGDSTLLITLSVDTKKKIVQVQVSGSNGKPFLKAKARVQKKKAKKLDSAVVRRRGSKAN